MPVSATPVWERTFSELETTSELDILSPEIGVAYGEQLLAKKRGCRARENTTCYLRMNMRGSDGTPVDLTNYGIAGSTGLEALDESSSSSSSSSSDLSYGHVMVRFREASLVISTTYQILAAVLSANDGIIMCRVPSQVLSQPGVWFAEAGAIDTSDNLLFTDECYVYVESSAWTTSPSSTRHGPPLIEDIRLAMRDNSPYENELTEEFAYTMAEISQAAVRTINFWNEQPPLISVARYSTISFPFREIWTQGIKLFLFQMAEEHYRRNHFKHSSGGVTTDDKNRHREYNAAWKEQHAQFKQLVMHEKARINANQAYTAFGSGYNWR